MAGHPVFIIGDPPGGMCGLVSGGLAVSVAPGERGPYFAHFARPGAWFGDAAVITHQARRIGLAATRDSELLHLPLHEIDRIVTRNPAAWRWSALVSVGHLDVAMGACDDLMIRDHVKRCIAIILRLGGCREPVPKASAAIEVDLTQEDLAAIANVGRTTAGAVLRMLECEGHVALTYRRIHITAPSTLRAMICD
jgi:CRP/FNR family transcriptional regulator, cyclic AMP receptor protein